MQHPILFLDMDGVVATSSTAPALDRIRPACVARLDALVRSIGARVVISSTWRTSASPATIRRWLAAHGYTGDVDSVTPILAGYTRGAEIEAWLHAHEAWGTPFVILDDWPAAEFRGLLGHLVSTDYDTGLDDDDCARAIRLLDEQRRGRPAHLSALGGDHAA